MKETKGICATLRGWYWFHLALGVFSVGYGAWYAMTARDHKGWALAVCGVFVFCVGVYHLIVQYHLDEEGITVRRFGEPVRFLAWRDVAQIHKIHRYSFSLRSSSHWVIVITPKGCPAYVPGASCDSHLADCRGQAIVLDDSKKTRDYIAEVWGRVTVMGTKGDIIE